MFYYISLLLCSVPIILLLPKIVFYATSLNDARRFAATSPLPSVVVYSPRDSRVFWLLSNWIEPVLKLLPFRLGHWIQYVKRDFAWASKGELARTELNSDAYWTVGPGGPHLYISDAGMISQVVHRWKDFPKPIEQYGALDLFGPNVVTTEGSNWQRHRKITGPPFNERNSSLVFQETLRQANAMLASFTHDESDSVPPQGQEPVVEDLVQWTMTATLNVISGAGFNLKMDWPIRSVAVPLVDLQSEQGTVTSKATNSVVTNLNVLSFQKTVNIITNSAQLLIIFPPWMLRNSPFQFMRELQQASESFVTYMRGMILNNRSEPGISKGADSTGSTEKATTYSPTAGDLLGTIVKAGKANESMALNEEETIGNIFIFIMAGHETTASSLQTGLILLAIYPESQKAVQAEIDSIWAQKQPGDDLSYDDYPNMREIMAVMLETLRLYPPVVSLPKTTRDAQTLDLLGQSIYVPPNTSVTLSVVSVQRNPKYWGPDSHEFLPSRWLQPSPYTAPPNTSNESTTHADLLCPPKGAFLAFSGGFRACLGKKFAQVEFCTLLAVLLKDHSVELVREGGEEWSEARDKALGALENRVSTLAMRMREKVKVRFLRRGTESFSPHS